jgi:cysteine desulfuration protein SufE
MGLQRLVDTFEFLDNWEDRYQLLIDLGKDPRRSPRRNAPRTTGSRAAPATSGS